jgi:hypothetical protein
MKTLFFFFVFVFSFLFAQDVKPIDVVEIHPSPAVTRVKEGYSVSLTVKLDIKKGWHINAHTPLDSYLIPTNLLFDSSKEIVKLAFSDDQLALYLDQAVLKATLTVPKRYSGTSMTIHGTVQYQPCNDQTCLIPVKKPFSIVVSLKK